MDGPITSAIEQTEGRQDADLLSIPTRFLHQHVYSVEPHPTATAASVTHWTVHKGSCGAAISATEKKAEEKTTAKVTLGKVCQITYTF